MERVPVLGPFQRPVLVALGWASVRGPGKDKRKRRRGRLLSRDSQSGGWGSPVKARRSWGPEADLAG